MRVLKYPVYKIFLIFSRHLQSSLGKDTDPKQDLDAKFLTFKMRISIRICTGN